MKALIELKSQSRVETERFAETEKISEKQTKNQGRVDGFLTAMELCTTNSQLSAKLSTKLSTWRI
jgi:hypothetical protein